MSSTLPTYVCRFSALARLTVSSVLVLQISHPAHAEAAANSDAKAPNKAPIVVIETAKHVELADVITYPARVTSRVKAAIYAPNDGVITRTLATLGAPVRAGAPVVEIKNTDPAYEYVPVTVETPVSGVISTVDVTPGSKVTKGQSLATVTDPQQTLLLVEVPAADLAAFQSTTQGSFTLPLMGDKFKPLEVKVQGLSPLVDPATGTATAELAFVTRPPLNVAPLGAIGKVAFAINKRLGIQVPEQAIVYRGAETVVRTVVAGKSVLVPVVTLATRRGLTEIASGLNDGTQVIVRASGFIADGQEVTVQNPEIAHK